MILFGLSVLFVLSISAFVAQEMKQDVTITFLILLIVFSGLTYKRRVNNELKILKSSMEVSLIYKPMKIGGLPQLLERDHQLSTTQHQLWRRREAT